MSNPNQAQTKTHPNHFNWIQKEHTTSLSRTRNHLNLFKQT